MNNTGNNQTFRSTLRHIVPAVLVMAGFGGYTTLSAPMALGQDAAAQGQAPAGQRTDGQVEMDVVHALDAAPSLQQDWITAGTVQGEVTLSGTSASEANRQLAESIAAKVPGVIKVVNNLKVGDPQAASNGEGQPQDQVQPDYPAQDPSSQAQGTYDNGPQPAQPAYPQPGYPQPAPQPGYQPDARGAYYPPQPAQPQVAQVPEGPREPVQLAKGTLLKVRSSEPLDSKKAKPGTPVEFTVVRDVYAAGVLAVPRGATVRGEIIDVKKAGALEGHAELALKLDSLELGGKSYQLD